MRGLKRALLALAGAVAFAFGTGAILWRVIGLALVMASVLATSASACIDLLWWLRR